MFQRQSQPNPIQSGWGGIVEVLPVSVSIYIYIIYILYDFKMSTFLGGSEAVWGRSNVTSRQPFQTPEEFPHVMRVVTLFKGSLQSKGHPLLAGMFQ